MNTMTAARRSIALGLLIAGCNGVTPAGQLSGEPLVVGPVESVAHRATASGIVVRAAAGSREMCGISATADAQTLYLRRAPDGQTEPAAVADLAVGDTVEVYVEGPVAESCPVQGRASAIVILERRGR